MTIRSLWASRCQAGRQIAVLLVLAAVLPSVAGTGATRETLAAQPPAGGFGDELVTAAVDLPTALAFTPDGRLLIAAKAGQLWLDETPADATDSSKKVLDLTRAICSNGARGLLGVAVDPQFEANGYIYVYYTFKKHGTCPARSNRNPVNRVVRLVLQGDRIVPSANKILIDNIPTVESIHNGGDLQFGPDELLYVTVGDGGCDFYRTTRCQDRNGNARRPQLLLGKVLRVDRNGAVPATNPYQGAGTARCATTGRAAVGVACREVFAKGLRNPFRLAFDPNMPEPRFFVNDVGGTAWEEIDEGRAGADYGWNLREGGCARGSLTECGTTPAGLTDPVYSYDHRARCSSITGGAFVPNGTWAGAYDGAYFYADYVCERIFALTPGADGSFRREEFARVSGGPVSLLFGPAPGGRALYYATFAGGGEVRRLAPVS